MGQLAELAGSAHAEEHGMPGLQEAEDCADQVLVCRPGVRVLPDRQWRRFDAMLRMLEQDWRDVLVAGDPRRRRLAYPLGR